MSSHEQLAEHLRVYAALGVNGFSRDPAWRARGSAREATDIAVSPIDVSSLSGDDVVHAEQELAGTAVDPAEALADLRDEIGPCTRCILHTLGRKQVVFGVGNPHARLMFVGEAPGADEDEQGEPFVGAAGQLLTKIIEAIDLTRADVYIANVIKCRPPTNRNPEPAEVATCSPFLMRQIDAIRPKVIVALGKFAAQTLLATDAPISRLRGRVHAFHGGINLVPTFHPAYLLRSPEKKREVWEDMKMVRGLLAE